LRRCRGKTRSAASARQRKRQRRPIGRGQARVASAEAPWIVRRLLPVECERLQGFPDQWTAVPFRGRRAADTPRYRAIGNSMAVPCMRFIGERLLECWLSEGLRPRDVVCLCCSLDGDTCSATRYPPET
jgi:site-specific DNA-cytosine methylase